MGKLAGVLEPDASSGDSNTICIQRLLDQLQKGDTAARDELIQFACTRLERLTRKMLRGWQRVHRWEETGDVLQNSLLRLYRSLGDAKPATPVDFYRLAALNIRRELYDLARHYYGPRGEGANHATVAWKCLDEGGRESAPIEEASDGDEDPANLAAWAEFHAKVDCLPEEEREIFDLLWYQELSQTQAASLLSVSERTVRRRWVAARLKLCQFLGENLPDQKITAL